MIAIMGQTMSCEGQSKGLEIVTGDELLNFDDEFIAQAWVERWKGIDGANEVVGDAEDIVKCFLRSNRESHGFRSFVAVSKTQKSEHPIVLAWIHCQVWNGPVPIEVVKPNAFRLGTVWGLSFTKDIIGSKSRRDVAAQLVEAAVACLKSKHCKKVLAWAMNTSDYQLLRSNQRFKPGNMMTLNLTKQNENRASSQQSLAETETGTYMFQCAGECADTTVSKNWKRMWMDCGIPGSAFEPDMEDRTLNFIQHARNELCYQTFVAKDTVRNEIIGSVSCQVWTGPIPQVRENKRRVGTIWAVYVAPAHRRKGVATTMMKMALEYLHATVGCEEVILVAASAEGERVYRQLGFRPNLALVHECSSQDCDDSQMTLKNHLENHGVYLDEHVDLQALATATSRQILAVFESHSQLAKIIDAVAVYQSEKGTYIDPRDNWFTQNQHRFGKGFDMKVLRSNEERLTRKFDRLAPFYDHWTVGNESQVESFTVNAFRKHLGVSSSKARILDVACGIGLQGQVLRLCGFDGHMVGCDVSPAMVERVVERGCYNETFVANANRSLKGEMAPTTNKADQEVAFDVVICTGALELLDHDAALTNMLEVLNRANGQLWLSFQLIPSSGGSHGRSAAHNPTEHQNVAGISREDVLTLLKRHNLKLVSTVECEDAFYTPSPNGSTLLPVPYLFVVAEV